MLFRSQIQPTGIEGKVVQALYLGPATEYLVRGGEQIYRVLELRRRGAKPHTEGASVSLGWKPDEALIFPTGP